MSGIETTAFLLMAVWIGALTLVVVLLVRQHGLVVARLQAFNAGLSPSHDGPDVGSELAPEVMASFAHVNGDVHYIMLLSATCGPCRGLVSDLRGKELPGPLSAILPGREEAAENLVSLMPDAIPVLRDPEASVLAAKLGIHSSPFGLSVRDGVVTGKSYLNNASDLMRLMSADEPDLEVVRVDGGE